MSSDGLDEMLSEAVREYPAIYDKTKRAHHDRNVVKNCWEKVAEVCGIEDHKEAIRLFGNLKKRYNKSRNKLKQQSGSASNNKPDPYAYLTWLQPHVILRSTTTNISKLKVIKNEANAHSSSSSNEEEATRYREVVEGEVEVGGELPRDEAENDELFSLTPPNTILACSKSRKTSDEQPTKARKLSETTGREKWAKKKVSDVQKAELSFFSAVEKSLAKPEPPTVVAPEVMDSNDLFAKFVGSRLKELPVRAQRQAQHEIGNILFKIGEQYEAYSASIPQQNPYTMQQQPYAMPPISQRAQQSYTVSAQQPYVMQCALAQYLLQCSQQEYGQISTENCTSTKETLQQYNISSPVFPSISECGNDSELNYEATL